MGIPAATTRDHTTVPLDDDDDPIEFQGAWCATVSNAQAAAAFAVSTVDNSDDEDDLVVSDLHADDESIITMFSIPDDLALEDDLASLESLSSVEREMFLQVEHNLSPGVHPTKYKTFAKPSKAKLSSRSDPVLRPTIPIVSRLPSLFERELIRLPLSGGL